MAISKVPGSIASKTPTDQTVQKNEPKRPRGDTTPPAKPEGGYGVWGRFTNDISRGPDPLVLGMSNIEAGATVLVLNRSAHPEATSAEDFLKFAVKLPIDTNKLGPKGDVTAVVSDKDARGLGLTPGAVIEVRVADDAKNLSEGALISINEQNDLKGGLALQQVADEYRTYSVRDDIASGNARSAHSSEAWDKYQNHPMASSAMAGYLQQYDVYNQVTEVSQWGVGFKLPELQSVQWVGVSPGEARPYMDPEKDADRPVVDAKRFQPSLEGTTFKLAADHLEPFAYVTVKNLTSGKEVSARVGEDGTLATSIDAKPGEPLLVKIGDHSSRNSDYTMKDQRDGSFAIDWAKAPTATVVAHDPTVEQRLLFQAGAPSGALASDLGAQQQPRVALSGDRLTLTPTDDGFGLSGGAGSATAGTLVEVQNQRTRKSAFAVAGSDGSFKVSVEAAVGDPYQVKASHAFAVDGTVSAADLSAELPTAKFNG